MNYDLNKIKAFVFDVDGVLSRQTVSHAPNGHPLRTTNVRDGYAMHHAVRSGYDVAVISGGFSEEVKLRMEKIGVKHVFMSAVDKTEQLKEYMEITGCKAEEIMYVGDDMIDYLVMKQVGVAVAPADACAEIKEIAHYVSPVIGGEGVARDVIERVMKVQGKWINEHSYYW